MLCLNKGNIALSSGSIWCTSYGNEIKRDKVLCTNDEAGGTQGLILGRFFS